MVNPSGVFCKVRTRFNIPGGLWEVQSRPAVKVSRRPEDSIVIHREIAGGTGGPGRTVLEEPAIREALINEAPGLSRQSTQAKKENESTTKAQRAQGWIVEKVSFTRKVRPKVPAAGSQLFASLRSLRLRGSFHCGLWAQSAFPRNSSRRAACESGVAGGGAVPIIARP